MRNRNDSKGGNSSRPSAGGSKSAGGGFFKRTKPETESRFSKPSIKKSSLKFSGTSENRGQKARPSFDHEKPREDRQGYGKPGFDKPGFSKPGYSKPGFSKPGFDKPGFDKPGFDKPRFDKPDFKKYGSDRGDNQRPFRREGDSDSRFKKDFGKKEFGKPDSERSFRPARGRDDFRPGDRKPFGDRSEKPRTEGSDRNREFKPRFDRDNDEREFRPRPERDNREFKPRADRGDREFKPRTERDDREFKSRTERDDREFKPRTERDGREFKPRTERDDREFKPGGERPARSFDRKEGDKPAFKKKDDREESGDKPYRSRFQADAPEDRSGLERRVGRYETAPRYNLDSYEQKKKSPKQKDREESDEIRLNRYIANAGICSRREADDLISSGQISVNGKIIVEMGYKVRPTDVVKYGKKALNPEKMVYILINKPKDYITTTDDPEERKTVLDLISGACSERVYPVGRLDRNTTGLLLLTNDGELAEKLTHPSSGIKKIYQAELDKPIATEDFEALQAGVELEDGFIRPDEVGLVTPDAQVVGLEIHSGRNRIVRRMFEHLGYEVQKLDRTVFAGLNKKDLPRGKWRFLTEKEVIKLKFLL